MRHFILAALIVVGGLAVTSFAASALQSWATAQYVAHEQALDRNLANQGKLTDMIAARDFH
ncbi:MAG: hypothetical protein ACHQK9_03685 [Reyranellales bacterium]